MRKLLGVLSVFVLTAALVALFVPTALAGDDCPTYPPTPNCGGWNLYQNPAGNYVCNRGQGEGLEFVAGPFQTKADCEAHNDSVGYSGPGPQHRVSATTPERGFTVGAMFATLGVGLVMLTAIHRRRTRARARTPGS